MTAIDMNATLAELVTAHPALAAHLDRAGLDYCCGGQRRLVDAVTTAGLDVNELLRALARVDAAPGAENWSSMGPAELVDHLESTHHAYLHDALPRVSALTDKVVAVHGTRHPELTEVARLVTELHADLKPHLLKEERALFPMIRELSNATTAPRLHCGRLANPIRVMGVEHDNAGDLLARLRRTTGDYVVPADGCASYHALYTALAELEADTHLHVHKENNVLFPAVLAAEAALGAVPS